MALDKITYDNKETLVEQPSIENKNKCTANDLNEIKTVVNNAIDGIETKQNKIDSSNKLSADLVDDTGTTNKFFSGNYNDLTNKPSIPQVKTSQTTSDTATYSCTYVNNKLSDTGWVDLSSYVNTSYFRVRSGFPPKVRKIGNVVYMTGFIYCTTAVGTNVAKILNAIPSQFRPTAEMVGAGVRFSTSDAYSIFIGTNGEVNVACAGNITTQPDYSGFGIGNLGPYLVG